MMGIWIASLATTMPCKTQKPFNSRMWKPVTTLSQWSLLRGTLLTTYHPSFHPPLHLTTKKRQIPQICKDDNKKAWRTRQAIHFQVKLELNRTHCPTNFTVCQVIVSLQENLRQRKLFSLIHFLHINRMWKSAPSHCSLSGLVVSTKNLNTQRQCHIYGQGK